MIRVKSWRVGLLCALALATLWLTAAAAAQTKSYRAERFDVNIVVEENGALAITESVVFNFVGEPFTFAYRELLPAQSDGILDITAWMDGQRLGAGENAGQVEISGRNPIKVTWHFAPTLGSHTFELRYRQLGVVRQDGAADVLRYQPLPDEFDYPIAASTVTVTFPDAADPLTSPTILTGNASARLSRGEVTFVSRDIAPNQTLVFDLRFPAGSLINAPPAWQQRQQAQRGQAGWWAVSGAGLTAVIVALLIGAARPQLQTRQPSDSATRYEPPNDLPPALAGALSQATVTWPHALGALFDLAARGVITIEETPRRRWGGSDFSIQRRQWPTDLRPHEQGLLTALFETRQGEVEAVSFSQLQRIMSSRQWQKFKDPLEAELKAAGWWSSDRAQARKRLFGWAVAALALGVIWLLVAGLWLQFTFGAWPLLWLIPWVVGCLLAVGLGSSIKPLTDAGAQQSAEWQSFSRYLRAVTRGRQAAAGPEAFERYLPYAAAFGLLERWVRYFQKSGWSQPPAWFHALPGTDTSSMVLFATMANNAGAAGGAAAGAAASSAGGGASGAG